ncbi:hypothetical protein [Schaalia turicensis]|uniref:hypothetical protein n=1 Tax=Schaalia turicensis TaxID=131111 RepID=UPI0018976A28|nr:hypothetical protein [Schaalia turicensis]
MTTPADIEALKEKLAEAEAEIAEQTPKVSGNLMPEPVDLPRKIIVRGLELTINPKVLADLEFLDLLAQIEDENPTALPRILRFLVGADRMREVFDVLRSDDGHVDLMEGVEFMRELTESLAPNS